ncbi:Serine/threonine-protein kinase PknL [Phycisphaerae bacterium RAS1]|nr:Serine/threonine-protein kinase PknL [Phycisphaerae bacterium RAS1]
MPRPLPLLEGYEFVQRVGRGAGAVISLAVHRATRRQVAIKHVIRRDADDEKFIRQAETEYDVASRFDNPYLRKCYEIVRRKKWFRTVELYLIMEYVDGEPLEDQCPERLEEIIPIFAHVAEGLQALHSYGFVHSDIKPNNIILTPSGNPKLIDFGQSCPIGHQKERIQGTADFIAPEQVRKLPLDHRTDIFNFGATMYWVVTGRYFETLVSNAPTAARKIDFDAQRSSAAPHELNPRLPLPLSKLIMDCVETNPESRPVDMRAVVARLEVALQVLNNRRSGDDDGRDDEPDGRRAATREA